MPVMQTDLSLFKLRRRAGSWQGACMFDIFPTSINHVWYQKIMYDIMPKTMFGFWMLVCLGRTAWRLLPLPCAVQTTALCVRSQRINWTELTIYTHYGQARLSGPSRPGSSGSSGATGAGWQRQTALHWQGSTSSYDNRISDIIHIS